MVEQFEAVEADMARYYAVDLLEAIWGDPPMSSRRLGALIRSLPPDSATARATDPHLGWTTTDQLLAGLVESVDLGNAMFYAANTGRDDWVLADIARPWQPAEEPETPKMSSIEEVKAFFGASAVYVPSEG
jgi:hypothetical protein